MRCCSDVGLTALTPPGPCRPPRRTFGTSLAPEHAGVLGLPHLGRLRGAPPAGRCPGVLQARGGHSWGRTSCWRLRDPTPGKYSWGLTEPGGVRGLCSITYMLCSHDAVQPYVYLMFNLVFVGYTGSLTTVYSIAIGNDFSLGNALTILNNSFTNFWNPFHF